MEAAKDPSCCSFGDMAMTFTHGEYVALLEFIDAGLRHNGLGSAEAAVVLSRKIREAMKPTPPTSDLSRKGQEND